MVNVREAQYILLHCHTDNLIDDEEFALLHDVNEQANPEFLHWTYPPFYFEKIYGDECDAEFRDSKNRIYSLGVRINIPACDNPTECFNSPKCRVKCRTSLF